MASVARLINCFEVPPGQDDDFLTLFGEMNAYMAARPGFLGNRLHRSLAPDARYRYVNYVDWDLPRTCARRATTTSRPCVRRSWPWG